MRQSYLQLANLFLSDLSILQLFRAILIVMCPCYASIYFSILINVEFVICFICTFKVSAKHVKFIYVIIIFYLSIKQYTPISFHCYPITFINNWLSGWPSYLAIMVTLIVGFCFVYVWSVVCFDIALFCLVQILFISVML